MPFAPDALTGDEDAVGEAVTRDDGTYELVVDHPDPARIVVQSADGALRLPARVVEIPDVERHVLDLEFAGVAVAGVVVDADSGQPLARAAVVADAWRAAADHSAATAISGPDGRFRIEVDPGTYRVSAHARGYAAAAAEVEVQDDGVSNIRLPLARGGTIKGRVVDERGRAAGGGMVRALSAAGAAAAAILPDGRFELSGLRDGAHTLVARGQGGQFAVQAGVTAGNEEPTLVLRRGGRLQLRLVGADGAPLPGAIAYLYRVAGLAVPGLSASAAADASGVATLLTPSGEVEVRADRPQGGTIVASRAATLAVEEGRTTTAEVRLARAVAEVPRPAGP